MSEIFLFLRRTESEFNENLIFWTDFPENIVSNFMKIRQVAAELFPYGRTDRQTDMTKLIVVFRNFTNSPNKGTEIK